MSDRWDVVPFVIVTLLCIGLLSMGLWTAPVERSESTLDTAREALVRQAQNREVETRALVVTFHQCPYCVDVTRVVSRERLLLHVRDAHGQAAADRVARMYADAWHRAAGVQ